MHSQHLPSSTSFWHYVSQVLWRCYQFTNTRFGIGKYQNPSHFYTYGWFTRDYMVTARQHLPPEFQIPMTRWEWCIFLWGCPLLDSGVPSSTSGRGQMSLRRSHRHTCPMPQGASPGNHKKEFWDTDSHLFVGQRGQGRWFSSQEPKSFRLSQELGPASLILRVLYLLALEN